MDIAIRAFVASLVVLSVSCTSTRPLESKIHAAMDGRPQPVQVRIVWEDIEGLPGEQTWKVRGTEWWVQLHPADIYPEDRLDRNRLYDVRGALVEQGYGTLHIWVYELKPVTDRP